MSSISSGSVTLFQQTTAQPGWTKLTTVNDYMLRVVNGANTTVASQPFSSVMTSQNITGIIAVSGTVNPATISVAQMTNHSHADGSTSSLSSPQVFSNAAPVFPGAIQAPTASLNFNPTGNTGSGTAHTHPLSTSTAPTTVSTVNFSVKYVDVILARRNY